MFHSRSIAITVIQASTYLRGLPPNAEPPAAFMSSGHLGTPTFERLGDIGITLVHTLFFNALQRCYVRVVP